MCVKTNCYTPSGNSINWSVSPFVRVERSLPSKLVDPKIGGKRKAEDKNKHEDVIFDVTFGSFSQKAYVVTQFRKLSSFQPLNVKCRWHVWQ